MPLGLSVDWTQSKIISELKYRSVETSQSEIQIEKIMTKIEQNVQEKKDKITALCHYI